VPDSLCCHLPHVLQNFAVGGFSVPQLRQNIADPLLFFQGCLSVIKGQPRRGKVPEPISRCINWCDGADFHEGLYTKKFLHATNFLSDFQGAVYNKTQVPRYTL